MNPIENIFDYINKVVFGFAFLENVSQKLNYLFWIQSVLLFSKY